MRFQNLRLKDFRNIEFADIDLGANRVFLLGSNGQGKSNLLEALGFTTALRSFRTQNLSPLIRHGALQFMGVYSVQHEREGAVDLEIHSGKSGRKVLVDGDKVSRLADFIGRYPVVALSAEDLMLLRGSPAERRRFLDLTLSAIDGEYYMALRNFHRGIAERNRLLKKGGGAAELSAFESEIAVHAVVLCAKRVVGVERFGELLIEAYTDLAEMDEGPELSLSCSFAGLGVEEICELLEQSRTRDEIMGATQKGPHRDDLLISLRAGGAKEYASDGQQRGLCVALRLAQARIFEAALGVAPVLLVDDVLGELDAKRRSGFWRACPGHFQIIASGTEAPAGAADWDIVSVSGGTFGRS